MNRIKRIQFSNCVVNNGRIYGFLDDGAYPVEIDLETRDVRMTKPDGMVSFQIDSLLRDGQVIYILELNGKRLIQYDIDMRKFQSFSVNYAGEAWGNFVLFSKEGNIITIFPKESDGVIKVDLQNNRIWKETIECFSKKRIQFSCAFRKGRKVYLFLEEAMEICIYDLQNETIESRSVDCRLEHLLKAVTFDNCAFLLGETGSIYRYSIFDDSLAVLRKGNANQRGFWGNLAVTKKNIWMLPSMGEEICILDRECQTEKILKEYPFDFSYFSIEGWSKYYGYCEDSDNYYFAMRLSNYMLKIDKNSGEFEWMKFRNPQLKDWYDTVSNDTGIVYEDNLSGFHLQEFLNIVNHEKQNDPVAERMNTGRDIYENMKCFDDI